MTRSWLAEIPATEARRAAIAAAVPVLETKRLVLRAPELSDWPVLEPIWRGDRARFIGGPFNEEDAWLDFAQAVAGWVLRGIGYWTITAKSDAEVLGLIGIGQEVSDPEPEFGWLLTKDAEGQGFAYETARAVRDHASAQCLPGPVSFIDSGNTRSIALAERLGATREATRDNGDGPFHIYRHRGPEALQ